MNTTVFLGGGRITSALVAGLRRAGHKGVIVVHDRNAEKLRALHRDFGVAVEPDLRPAVSRADMLIIAVRPTAVAEMLEEVARYAGASRLLAVSLAAGIPLKKLRPRLGARVRWARALPSPIGRIGRGLTAVAFARNVPRADRMRVRRFFEQVGLVLEMAESRLDAFNAAYSPAHGYTHWQLWPKRRRIRDWTPRRRSRLRPMPARMQSSIGGRAARTSPTSCMKRQRLAGHPPRHWQPWTRPATGWLSSEASQPVSGKRGQMLATDVPELASHSASF
jgi:NADP oxidoreductase coenzyme F420-dependent